MTTFQTATGEVVIRSIREIAEAEIVRALEAAPTLAAAAKALGVDQSTLYRRRKQMASGSPRPPSARLGLHPRCERCDTPFPSIHCTWFADGSKRFRGYCRRCGADVWSKPVLGVVRA